MALAVGLCQKADLQDDNAFALSGRNDVMSFYPGRCPGLTAALRLQRTAGVGAVRHPLGTTLTTRRCDAFWHTSNVCLSPLADILKRVICKVIRASAPLQLPDAACHKRCDYLSYLHRDKLYIVAFFLTKNVALSRKSSNFTT